MFESFHIAGIMGFCMAICWISIRQEIKLSCEKTVEKIENSSPRVAITNTDEQPSLVDPPPEMLEPLDTGALHSRRETML